MDEDETVKQVRAVLEKDPRINLHQYPIDLSMHNGDLIMSGEMEDIVAKKLALVAASETFGVQRIVDRLKVIPAVKMGDAEIRDHVCKVLTEEAALEHCLIRKATIETVPARAAESAAAIIVEVKDGVVTLNGEVPSLTHKRLAGVLAWWVPGTRDVINGLEEVPPQEDSDDELIDAVRLVLEKDPFVNATDIGVTAQDSIVTLHGLVPNQTMKQMAEHDASYVLGVKQILNHIQVRL
jgi:osmotically-inducible protein OsmY